MVRKVTALDNGKVKNNKGYCVKQEKQYEQMKMKKKITKKKKNEQKKRYLEPTHKNGEENEDVTLVTNNKIEKKSIDFKPYHKPDKVIIYRNTCKKPLNRPSNSDSVHSDSTIVSPQRTRGKQRHSTNTQNL